MVKKANWCNPSRSGGLCLCLEPSHRIDFPKIATLHLGEEVSCIPSHVARRVSGKQILSEQSLRSAGRRELSPTLARLYRRIQSPPSPSRVPAMKATSPSRLALHRFWLLNVPGSNSRLISPPSL